MVLYDRFYKKVGIRKSGHFTSPLIIEASTLQYPKNSDIYYFKVSDVVEKLSSDIPLLNKPNQIFVKSKFYYSEEANAGKFVKVPFVLNTRLDEIKGKEKKMMFLRPNVKRTITNRAIVLYNYSSMGASYRYIGVNFTKLYKFNNILTTVVEDLAQSTEPRHKFLIIDLPDTLPKLQKLNLFATSLNISRLKSITTYKYFTLLELWKLIHPNMRDKSIFNRIPEKEWENITLLFTLNNKVAVFNMALFKLLIKEYNKEEVSQESLLDSTNGDFFEALLNEYDLSIESLGLEDNVNLVTKVSYKSTLFRRMFYVFLFKVITQKKSLPVEEIEELLSKGITGLSPDSKEKKSLEIETEKVKHSDTEEKLEKVLDSIIDQDVPISNVKDDNPDSLLGDNVEEVERTTEEQENAEIYEEEDNSIESKILLDTNNTVQNTYGSLDLILKEKPKDPEEDLLKNVSLLKDYGTLSKLEEKKIRNILLDQKERKSPYKETPEKLSEILYNIKPEEKQIENPDVNDNNVIFDKSYNKNTTKNFDRAYIEKSLKKDTIRTVYALQNFNNIIEDYQIESTSSILDTQETHIIKMRTLTGSPSKIKIHLPKIEEDGTFRMSGNKYLIRKQRTETPIKKINGTTVVLNSYYGKVFIHKALQKRDDFGYWFSRQLFKLYEGEVVKDLIEGTVKVIDRDLPVLYSQIARYTLGFTIGKYNFNFKYKDRETLVGKKDIEKIEQKEFVVCGTIGKNEVILMDKKNQLTSYHLETGIVNHLPKMEEILKLDLSQAPVEYSTIKIGKHHIPLVLLLSYYIGLENLLKVLKVDYYFTETNKRLEDKQYTYRFKFKDGYLTCKQDQGLADMIIYGLDRIKTLDQVNFKAFQDRATFNSVFSYLEINVNVITEIKMLEKLFVDPMTRVLLEQLGEPETFKGLLFRASELLLDDNAKHPNNMSEQVVKGYERLNGILYKSLITAVKEHENRANFSKSKVEVDPFVVMKKIKDDSSTVLIDDLNPLAMIKQTEDVTYLGEFGRQEITMTKETRVIHPTEIGVISEAAKDNGSVGITAYLSSNPALNSLTGTVGAEENKTLEWGDILSTSALLSPFSTTDDSKRLNFINIQSAHVIPINEMTVPYVRTGYESILPVRTGEKFATYAEDEGMVEEVTPKGITVKYKSGSKTYKMYSWTTKEESGSCFTHTLVTDLKKGDKVSKDDTLTYNPSFFEPDIFNPKRVIYKQGTVVNVAIVEDPETFEDSGSISKKLSSRLGTTVTKVRSIVLDNTDNIHNLVKIGDTVNPGDSLFSFTTGEDMNPNGMDESILAILQDIKTSTPKSKVKGRISNIVLYYNCEIEDLSPSLQKIAKESDSRLKHEKGYPGRVNSSYSIRGKPLNPNEIEIKIYTQVDEGMSIGDKAIFGNQLKFTVGAVFDNIVTERGEEVDATFGFISIQNRIVNSPNLLGTTNTLVKLIQDKAVEMYFK